MSTRVHAGQLEKVREEVPNTCIGVENPHINKGAFQTTTPDSISGDIKAGLLTRDCRSVAKPFSSNRLEMWLHADIGANTLQEAGSDVTDLVMAN